MVPFPWKLLLLLLPAVATAEVTPPPSYPPTNGTTVYELLSKFGLPPGLLPSTVTSFSLSNNGDFEVNLAGECYVDFEYLVYYEPKITGSVSYGSISGLKGIQVRRFLIWFDVDSIKVDLPPAGYIYFNVGWITKKLRIQQFESIHSCRSNVLADITEGLPLSFLKHSGDAEMLITE
ncbi:hypothetical protein HPP92_020278 [Vanilla planifolia]|uniref:Uncharacterized protein n=1 Tax=Vanilla planifolia TaxID=51239 RepID=A0A835PU25_VANPL|nr:hypothetical protein HPP92_020683 [Vanilla planifolia]KAG0461802.1 hypothetical protein HPP92_020278 [Vanilla planifolia]